MGEQDSPLVTDKVMELDITLGGFGFKVYSM